MDLKLEDAFVYKQLKKFFQSISSDQLAMVINHLSTLYERKRKKEEAITEKTRKRQEALDQIKHLMSAAQISLTDVNTAGKMMKVIFVNGADAAALLYPWPLYLIKALNWTIF